VTALEPDELRRLLAEAVEPVRASPVGYGLIRAGVIRRRRMRAPVMTVGGLALVGLIGFAYAAIEPRIPSTSIESAHPPLALPTTPRATAAGTLLASAGRGAGRLGITPLRSSVTPSRLEETPVPSTPPPSPSQLASPTPVASRPSGTPSTVHASVLPSLMSIPARPGDADGDGRTDPVTVSGTTVTVALSSVGGTSAVGFPAVASPLASSIIDIDADGRGELIVQTGSGADIKDYGVARLAPSGQLRAVAGGPLRAGFTGVHGAGFRCEAGKVMVVVGERTADRTYQVTSTAWQLTDTGFTAVGVPTNSTVGLAGALFLFTAGCGIN
jgi:hypothetical protein